MTDASIKYLLDLLKGTLSNFGEEIQMNNLDIYNINGVIHNWINKWFWEENQVPRTQFEADINCKVKKSQTLWNGVVICLLSLSSHENKEFVYALKKINKPVNENHYLFIKISSPK